MRTTTLPRPRGELTEHLFSALRAGGDFRGLATKTTGDDAALALWVLHELHYRGLTDIDDALEWDPQLLRVRRQLEADLEDRLRSRFHAPAGLSFVEDALDWIDEQDGPSLARHVHRNASRDQVLDLLAVRSIYHLKESDPVAWVVPRLGVRAKAALMELQYDEYGGGDPNRLHHHLFELGMEASGLDPAYDAHLDAVPLEALEQNNTLSLFGLHRRLRGAALGHLAAFEATSSLPSRRMAEGLRRLDFPDELVEYYTEHVEADAVHEQLAVRTICAGLLAEEPELEGDVWFGAYTCLDLESRFAHAMFARWGIEERAA
ncbi:iron-containing redox enzyme family protein [Nocardioides sp. SR21]|uniref:iron-containing redox enzyme family protein n=1 Tax=Nocardioides sp. SR21 TaxID=2919501 RepID=UPI001FAA071D|nr:iron-containing redox enzyme family protein [Nocardioides sp. SR21]